ncbi:MAG: hypothetical protein ACR2II_09965 [Chthoniobacterales bacterium]
MKRASWQKIRERRGTWRALSFLFLFLVVLSAPFAYFFFANVMPRQEREKPVTEGVASIR